MTSVEPATTPGNDSPLPEVPSPEQSGLLMAGVWETCDERYLTLYGIVTSVKHLKRKTRKKAQVYRIDLVHVRGGALGCWRLTKQSQNATPADVYCVILHRDGSLSCDCPWATYAHPDTTTLCAHKSAVLTLADAFKPIVLPLPLGVSSSNT